MVNYPIKSLDNKFTYGIGIYEGKNKSESKIILQLSDVDNQQQVRVSMDREEFHQFMTKLKEYYLHYF
jgi:hypothetical protein